MTGLVGGRQVRAVEVLVVGAGPTGLLAAAELSRRGVECLLIDAHERPLEWDRATVVHPRSLEILDSLGIVEPLLSAGVRQKGARLYAGGEMLGEIDLAQCGSRYPFNIGISEEATEAILTDYLRGAGGDVTRATRLVSMREVDDGIVATLERAGAETEVIARWVVGCDGHHSTVRTLAGIGQNGHDIVEPWAVFDAAIEGWPHSFEANYCYLEDVPVILTALPGRRWRVYLRPASAESDLVADAASTIARYLPSLRFTAVANPTRFHCHTKVAQKFRLGRILLAGDAAHTCSPAQGHGMNSGLQDAFNLAWKLALVCGDHCNEALLDSYEAERKPVAEMITKSGDNADSAQLLRGETDRRARDEAIRGVLADPEARHHEAVAEAELDIDYNGSPIVLGDRNDVLWPGQRLPDWIEVSHPAGRRMLHQHAGCNGHTAILLAGTSANGEAIARARRELEPLCDGTIVESTVAFASGPDVAEADGYIEPLTTSRLGVGGLTLLLVRADGHVGLRADTDHAVSLESYVNLLRAQPA